MSKSRRKNLHAKSFAKQKQKLRKLKPAKKKYEIFKAAKEMIRKDVLTENQRQKLTKFAKK